MSNFCPVCKSAINDNTVKCGVCNFTDLHREFITKEDAQEWLDSIVLPYRDNWENKVKNADIDEGFVTRGELLCGYKGSKHNLIIPNGVKWIGDHAFFGYSNLESVSIPNSVTKIGDGAFWKCVNLRNIIFSENLKFIGDNAFCYCLGLESIDIPNSVTEIGDFAFLGCSNLRVINIPSGVTKIGQSIFGIEYKFIVKCFKNSYAHKYAIENNIPVQFID